MLLGAALVDFESESFCSAQDNLTLRPASSDLWILLLKQNLLLCECLTNEKMSSTRGNGHVVEAFLVSGRGQVRVGDDNHFYMGNLGW
jgi:hypothetical protein